MGTWQLGIGQFGIALIGDTELGIGDEEWGLYI